MTSSAEPGASPGLYRLLAWASPSFPTGAFSYSHGLEAVVEQRTVRDRASLEAWIAAVMACGSGRIDADILCAAYRAVLADDLAMLDAVSQRGVAYRATAELALESAQQGEAFLVTHRAAWARQDADRTSPHPNPPPQADEGTLEQHHPPPLAEEGRVGAFSTGGTGGGFCHSAAFGAAAARAGIPLEDALVAYLHAFTGNLVSAGLRLGVIGQTDGQRIVAALELAVAAATRAAMSRDPADFGSATFAVNLASMAHEAQYSRLFRS